MFIECTGGRSIEGPMILYGLLSAGCCSVRSGVSGGMVCNWMGVLIMCVVLEEVCHW